MFWFQILDCKVGPTWLLENPESVKKKSGFWIPKKYILDFLDWIGIFLELLKIPKNHILGAVFSSESESDIRFGQISPFKWVYRRDLGGGGKETILRCVFMDFRTPF